MNAPAPLASPVAPIGLVVAVLVLASSVGIMSTDMYAPSLPYLADHFGASASTMQLTISLNLLAFGLAQLVHGPLSDRLGRRPVLIGAMLAVAVTCIGCAAARTVGELIAARVAMGLGAAGAAVVGLAVIKDLYDETEQVRALALLGMVIAIAPAAAPVAGGYLHVHFGWRSNFVAIGGAALLAAFVVYRHLPESTVPEPGALAPRRVLGGYARLLRRPSFVVHSAMLGAAFGLILAFITGAPFVLIEGHGIAPDRFGWYQASIVAAFFLGSTLASRAAGRVAPARLLGFGVALVALGTLILGAVVLGGFETPVRFTGAYLVMTFGMGPLFATAPSLALSGIDGQAGTAAALLSGIEQTIAGCAAVLVSLLAAGGSTTVAGTSLALAAGLLVLYRVSRRLGAAGMGGPSDPNGRFRS